MGKMIHWAREYQHCKSCHTTDRPHHGNGLCKTCYYKGYEPPERVAEIRRIYIDNLERFANDLPMLFKKVGITGYAASYDEGTVTIRKFGSKLSVTWPD